MDDYPAALIAFDRADALSPDTGWIIAERAETYRLAAATTRPSPTSTAPSPSTRPTRAP